VREEFPGEEAGVGADDVGGAHGQHTPAQWHTPQQRLELGHLEDFAEGVGRRAEARVQRRDLLRRVLRR